MADYITEEGVEALRVLASASLGPTQQIGFERSNAEAQFAHRLRMSREILPQMLETIFPGDKNRQEQATQAHKLAEEALRVLEGGPGNAEAPIELLAQGLEVVVHTDGSRPSYLVRNDTVIQATAPSSGPLLAAVVEAADGLPEVLQAIGRINRGLLGQHTGTGWLIAPGVIITNRHVAEYLIDEDENGLPKVRTGSAPKIDFGHEHSVGGQGVSSRWRTKISELLFLGQSSGTAAPLDVALFRLESVEGPPKPLTISKAKPGKDSIVAVSGYPGAPDPNDPRSAIISALFSGLWGVKRFAPGFVTGGKPRQLYHDASTLGGNSGSPVLSMAPIRGVALHFGGMTDNSRNNAEALGQILTVEGRTGPPFRTLGNALKAVGAKVD